MGYFNGVNICLQAHYPSFSLRFSKQAHICIFMRSKQYAQRKLHSWPLHSWKRAASVRHIFVHSALCLVILFVPLHLRKRGINNGHYTWTTVNASKLIRWQIRHAIHVCNRKYHTSIILWFIIHSLYMPQGCFTNASKIPKRLFIRWCISWLKLFRHKA